MAGAGETWFAGVAKRGVYTIVAHRSPKGPPATPGTVQDYCGKFPGDVSRRLLFNSVKLCPGCGKPCAVTLLACNRCNTGLSSVLTTETPNLFSAFMLGVENSGTFPLRISIRHETDSLMVFDDPLALSPAHFCAIPTTDFIPDWRYLLCQPKRGLELVRSLLNACHKVLTEQFLENSEWKSTVLRSPDMEAKQHTLVGFNYPPSQNQLHVQYIVPPLMPHQFYMYCRGQHFTYNRFFPLSYVEKCLNELAKKDEAPDTQEFLLSLPIDDLIVMLDKKCNASYQREHCAFLSRVEVLQNHFGNWAMDNFEGVYHVPENTGSNKGKLLFKKPSGESFYVDEPSAIAEDKKRLQNYGRPYDEKENPSGGFYSFAKKLVDIKVWS